jgi:hypothetical protein
MPVFRVALISWSVKEVTREIKNSFTKLNKNQKWEKYEMKIFKKFEVLIAALAVAGCSGPLSVQKMGTAPLAATVPPAVSANSCIERSAAALPPKNPVVELVWCIAETDELYDPNHLFRQTLGVAKYSVREVVAGGVRASSDGENNIYLPRGMSSLNFIRRDPKGPHEPGNRNFYIETNHNDVCITMEEVKATFGENWWLSPIPIAVPIGAVGGAPSPSLKEKLNPYGIFFKSPKLFMGDVSGSVDFEFEYQKCVRHISVQRRLDLIEYRTFKREEK